MPRFFVNKENIDSDIIRITGEDVNHIKKVLRLRSGDNIIVCDGNGNDFISRIDSIGTDFVTSIIVNSYKNTTEPSVEVTLLQAIPKSDKMDLVIQKSVELGVNRIVPVIAERTVVRFDGKKDIDSKVSRWQRIALEAAKQCNRGRIPVIENPVSFKESLKIVKEADLGIIPYENEKKNNLKNLLKSKEAGKIAMIVGPEGGFTDSEVQGAIEAGVNSVTLGPRILRTETAGIALLAIIMYELGDVGA